ncbi:MAG TPA: FAD-dependent oxidoreductase [Anaerolineales bacterium]|nr:FAD-dependent oxidoreductase [Anaerolineales bacterium]
MPTGFDVIVIGAGIMGCSSAFQLAGRGMKVGVFDKRGLGAGSTGKSSAIIRQHYSNEVTARMALHSLRVFQNFGDAVGGEAGFRRAGFLVLTAEKDVEGLRANVALQQRVGIKTDILSEAEVRRRWPFLKTNDLVAAAHEPDSGYADPNLTTGSYANAAQAKGAEFLLDTEVIGLQLRSGKVRGVTTSSGTFEAPVVVNCAGPWGARVARWAGIEVPISSCRVQVAFFRRPDDYADEHPVVADFTTASYWRPETGGLTLVGLIDPSELNHVVDPDSYNERVELDFVADAGDRLVRRFPAMENSASASGYAGLYAITPDWHPVIDELIEGSGFYLCSGFSGHGFKLGPAVGSMVADMVSGAITPGMDRRLFRLNRFAENEPVRGRYEYSIAG